MRGKNQDQKAKKSKIKIGVKVNFIDLANFVDDRLQIGPGLPGDLSGNNDVDFVDYGMFAGLWLTFCPDDWPLK